MNDALLWAPALNASNTFTFTYDLFAIYDNAVFFGYLASSSEYLRYWTIPPMSRCTRWESCIILFFVIKYIIYNLFYH